MSKSAAATIISFVCHPLLMPTFLFVVIYFFAPFLLAPFNEPSIILLIFIATFLIPVISVVTLYKTGTVKTFTMNEKGERAVPFTFTAGFYWIMSYMFLSQYKGNAIIMVLIMSMAAIITIIAIISFYWKISAHSAGIAGLIGFLMALNYKFAEGNLLYSVLVGIIVAGIIMSARLYLQVHNGKEIIAGVLLGFILSFTSIIVLT